MTPGEPPPGDDVAGGSASSPVLRRWGRGGTGVVLALAAVVLLLIGGTIGLALGGRVSDSPDSLTRPAADSVDVGFLRDMSVHHEQGVLLAHLVQVNGGRPEVASIGYDIEYQQTSQIGQMGGFLQLWGYSLNNLGPVMTWMTSAGGHDMAGMTGSAGAASVDATSAAAGAVMPGMATTAEVDRLKTLRGDASDAYFLQLMIRHHQGGVPMMDHAARYATNPVVRNMAQKMSQGQAAEVSSMTQLLEKTYGEQLLSTAGSPVPASPTHDMEGMSGTEATSNTAPATS